MERNCDKCIHHTSGMCDSWDCKMQTVEDVKKEAVKEYVETVVAELEKMRNREAQGCSDVKHEICCKYSDCGLCLMDRAISIVRGKE